MTTQYRYYFDNSIVQSKYKTIWYGYLFYIGDKIPITINHDNKFYSNHELEDILIEICNINFYISLIDNYIYISHDMDEEYYLDQFEKHIKKVIYSIEQKCNINITNGEFNANEMKPYGNICKYTILKKENNIILKKKILNSNKDINDLKIDNLKIS